MPELFRIDGNKSLESLDSLARGWGDELSEATSVVTIWRRVIRQIVKRSADMGAGQREVERVRKRQRALEQKFQLLSACLFGHD